MPTPTPITPTPKPATPKFPVAGLVGIILGTLVVGLAVGAFAYHRWFSNSNTEIIDDNYSPTINANTNTPLNLNTTINTNSDQNIDVNNINSAANTNTSTSTNTNTSPLVSASVDWQMTGLTPTAAISITKTNPDNPTPPDYYQLGTMKKAPYKDAPLYLLSASFDGPAMYPAYIRFVVQSGKRIVLTKASDDFRGSDGSMMIPDLDPSRYTLDSTTTISDIIPPTTITGPDPRQVLVRDEYVRDFFNENSLTKVFTSPQVGDVFTKVTTTATADLTTNRANTLYDRNGFYVGLPDGTVVVYKWQSDIMPEKGADSAVPTITWTNGTKNTAQYSLTDLGGCGGTNYISVISSLVVDPDRDLVSVGTTIKGDTVYYFKDTNHPYLKAYYDNVYQKPWEGEKVSYAAFIAARPVIFFRDPFDRLVKLQSLQYGPMVECGKPVIYLYPKTTTKVQIKLAPAGGFSVSEPVYDGGWQVTATPNGQLTDTKTGINYPYLYWEGRGGIYQAPSQGFVVARKDVPSFLEGKLSALGLRSNEISDFKEFWLPRMRAAPWYFVSFAGNQLMNQLAPLDITPTPDTVIRVLMDYQELSVPIAVKPQIIRTPKRNGFTVVEWGGVLR